MAGYFDAVKAEKAATRTLSAAPEPNNVVQIRGDLHPYAAAIRAAWLGRLDNLPRPWFKGAAWDDNCFVTARKLVELANSGWAGYPITDAHADYLAHTPHDNSWDKREKCWTQALEHSGTNALPEPPPNTPIPDVTVLVIDEDNPEPVTVLDLNHDESGRFWGARPILQHLHDFARARRVSPWAVLGVTLARVVTATPFPICLPPIIASKSSLNMFVGLVGPSGSGKGAAEGVACDALSVGYIEVHTTGSGEGIAHGYVHREKGQVVWHDDNHAVLFSVPEIDTLAAQGDRKGATLMPELRRGWSGERLGFGYADPTKRLPVPAHEYRMCLVAGIQPTRAACLIDDADGGTPQRFLWMPATDPQAPDMPPVEPPQRHWEAPPIPHDIRTVSGAIYIKVCDLAADTIKTARLAQLRNETQALDGHALLAQLKTAAALGLLEGRYEVTGEDWMLADTIARKSAYVRGAVVESLRAKARETNYGRAEAEANRAVHVAEKVNDSAAKRVCGVIVRKLRREGDWTAGSDLRRALASGDRKHFETALERLSETGLIRVEDDGKSARYLLTVVKS